MNLDPNRRIRRLMLLQLAAWPALAARGVLAADAPASGLVRRPLRFPADHGSHDGARTEWWYLTGWLRDARERLYGFQVTFFRSRVDASRGLRSRLAARQLLFAHAALTDLQGRRHWHDQRIARWNGLPPAWPGAPQPVGAAASDTDARIGDWRIRRRGDGGYEVSAPAQQFALELLAEPGQRLLLQGERGWSRKGPQPGQASFYYSQPQLRASGSIVSGGERFTARGRAWLDHEWSESLLHPDAVGWDWIGCNLDDGASLTAFRLRRADGSRLWAGGSFRAGPDAREQVFAADAVSFEPLRDWVSPRTGIRYPVAWRLATPAGRFELEALLDDQELDSRRSTGTLYWEGLSELRQQGRRLGLGYLELTGYGQRLKV